MMKSVYVHPSVQSEKLREILEEWGALSHSDEQADFIALKDNVEIDEDRDTILVVEDEGDDDRLFFDLGSENKIQSLLYVNSLENLLYQRSFRAFLDGQSMSFEDIFSEIETKNFKVSDHLSIGYYTDIVASESMSGEFNVLRLRKYLFDLFTFLGYLNKGDVAYLPFEVEFGVDGNNLFVKVHAHVQNFVREYLWGTIERKNDHIHFHELLTGLANESDLLDIHYLQSTSKLVFSALWNKDMARSSALFLHSIQSYGEREELTLRPRVQLEKSTVSQSTEDLPEEPIKILGGGEENSQSIIRVKRVVEFSEDQIDDKENFDREQLEKILGDYPDGSVPPKLSDEEKDYIVECVRQEGENERLNEAYNRITSDVEDDEFVEKVKSQVEDADLSEIESILVPGDDEDLGEESTRVKGEREDLGEETQIVSGEKENVGEETQVVSGEKENVGEETQRIAGEGEEDLEEEKITIKGEREDLTQEKWEVKRLGIQQFLDEKVQKIQENPNYSKENLEKEFKDHIQEELGVGEKEARGIASHFIDGALNEASEEALQEKGEVPEDASARGELIQLRRDVERLDNEKSDLKDKNERLLKMLSTAKEKVQMMQEVEDAIEEDDEEDEAESLEEAQQKLEQLRQQNQYLQKSIKSSHSSMKRLKETQERMTKSKDEEINRLREEKDELQGKLNEANNAEEKEELRNLREEKESLTSQVEMANERVSSLNEKLEQQKKDLEEKHREETQRLYSKISEGTQKIQEFKKEKEEAENELRKKNEEVETLHSEFEKLKNSLNEEENKEGEDQEQVVKDLEQKLRAEGEKLKESNRQIKQYEQKVRFLSAQLESYQKSNNNNQKNGGQGGTLENQAPTQKQLEHQVKQLTNNNERLEQSLEKTNEDLAEKKKEVHKLNQELNATKSKLAEYERKASKKAS